MEQLVWICDSHEVADERNSEIPQWPVQDEGGRWHHEQFPGQRVVYDHARVDFGFQVKPCAAPDDSDDIPSDVYLSRDGRWWKEVYVC